MDQDYKPGPLPFPIILVCGFFFFGGGGGAGTNNRCRPHDVIYYLKDPEGMALSKSGLYNRIFHL